mgnify:CR=1 FL=1
MIKKKVKRIKPITMAEVEAFLQIASVILKEFIQIMKQLPKVDKNGRSNSPFAEELYAKKEKAQRKLEECIEKLEEYRQWVEEQIKCCQRNLDAISAGKARLRTEGAITRFSAADAKLVAIYKRLVKLQDNIKALFEEIKKALSEAAKQQFSDNTPQMNSDFQLPSTQMNHSTLQLDPELQQLISMGPID